jgi:non-ribosomal peptide synthase protein (TIGR01720 family)
MLVDIVGPGRKELFEDVDLSRTVGCFTAIYPVVLDTGGHPEPVKRLMAMKDVLRQVPQNEIVYGLLRYQSKDASGSIKLRDVQQPEVSFHYTGRNDHFLSPVSIFKPVSDFFYPRRTPQKSSKYKLEVQAGITQSQLYLTWIYDQTLYKRETIERLADEFMVFLEALLESCQLSAARPYPPSDFPEAHLSQAELNDLLSGLESPGGS